MKILQNQVKQADFVRNRWAIQALSVGTNIAMLTKPETWSHISSLLRPGDIIEVTPQDRSWFAEVYVTAARGLDVRTKLLRVVDFSKEVVAEVAQTTEPTTTPVDADAEYYAKHYGGGKWRVIRVSDQAAMRDGMSKEEAEDYIEELT